MSSRYWPNTVVLACVALAGLGAACGNAGNAATTPSVMDHVHGVVPGTAPSSMVVATHYGLEVSDDGGKSWRPDDGLGTEMVAGLLHLPSDFVASLQPMAGMAMAKMTSANMDMPGMDMGSMATPNIGYSSDGQHWISAQGIPAHAPVAAIVGEAGTATVWASLLGDGVYQSADGGHRWHRAIPASVPISNLAVVGTNLVMGTPSGIFVTETQQPQMPALAQLNSPVNDLVVIPGCPSCVAAAVGGGGVAVSHDGGVTWQQEPAAEQFDGLYAEPGTTDLFGMVPSPSDPHHGVWRSSDVGRTWSRVLDAKLVDHLYTLRTVGGANELLAFQWGIVVYCSTDGGVTWTKLSRISPP